MKRMCFLAGLIMAVFCILVPNTNALILGNQDTGPPTINATLNPVNMANNMQSVAFNGALWIASIDNTTMTSPPGARAMGNVNNDAGAALHIRYNELNPAAAWEAGLHANNALNGTGMYTNSFSEHIAVRPLVSSVNTVRRYDNANTWTGHKAVMKTPNASKKMNGTQTTTAKQTAAKHTTWTGNIHT